jgi:hypothetical protein
MRQTAVSIALALGALSTWGCDNTTEPVRGAIRITLTTTGVDPDPNGYRIRVDQGTDQAVSTNASLVIAGLPLGRRNVLITDLADNCRLTGSATRVVTVEAADTVDVPFSVNCLSRIGFLYVQPQTSGADLDEDGYTITIDGGVGQQIARNGSVYDSMSVGSHTITLGGLASNCTVAAAAITVDVRFRIAAFVQHAVSCVERVGSVMVTMSTTGVEPDVNGYEFEIDGSLTGATVPSNGSAVIPRVHEGDRQLAIRGITPNCSVTGPNPRLVSVTYQATTSLAISVTCVAPAKLRATVSTTGTDQDPGYTLRVAHDDFSQAVPLTSNASVTLDGFGTGEYIVTLDDVSANCALSASTPSPRTVNLVSGNTLDVSFDVSCTPAPQIAFAYWGPNSRDIGTAKINATSIAPVASSDGEEHDPEYSPDGTRIAFRSDRDGNSEIYVANADGSSPVRLTNHTGYDLNPAWSPDGSRIAFRSGRDGNDEIYVMNADGSNVVRLTTNAAFDGKPSWSPNGSRIAFQSNRAGNNHIWIMNADGSNQTALTSGTNSDEVPAWSPDGSKIAFARDFTCYDQWGYSYYCTNIVVINTDGSGTFRFVSPQSEYEPAWSPDGKWIAVESSYCDYYYYSYCYSVGIEAIRADGTTRTRLMNGEFYNPTWRP